MYSAYNLGDSDSDDEVVEENRTTVEANQSELLTNITKNTSWNTKDIEKVEFYMLLLLLYPS